MTHPSSYTPALGMKWLSPFYDAAIAASTREGRWRSALVAAIDPRPNQVILDIGCGTGSLLRELDAACPEAHYIGIDPDPDMIGRARQKNRLRDNMLFLQGFLGVDTPPTDVRVDHVSISLVLHQVPISEKERILTLATARLRPGGRISIADYGPPSGPLTRFAYRQTVQRLDGFVQTEANAEGAVPRLMAACGFMVTELARFRTATGTIYIHQGELA